MHSPRVRLTFAMRVHLITSLALILVTAGCANSTRSTYPINTPLPPPIETRNFASPRTAPFPVTPTNAEYDISLQAALTNAPAVSQPASMISHVSKLVALGTSTTPPGPSPTPLPNNAPAESRAAQPMRDIQARVTFDSDEPLRAADALRTQLAAHHALIVKDELSRDDRTQVETIQISARLPAEDFDAFFAAIGDIGTIAAKDITVTDVTKQFHDSQLLLRNLETTMKRYEELLAQAKDVKDMLALEDNLTRLRGQIEQVKADLIWIEDKVARATLSFLIRHPPEIDVRPPGDTGVWPTIFTQGLWDFRGRSNGATTGAGFAGGGAEMRVMILSSRGAVFQVGIFGSAFGANPSSLASANASSASASTGWIALTGLDMYSAYFGGGRRAWFNPYFGFRVGASRFESQTDLPIGVAFGLDIYKGARGFAAIETSGLLLPVSEAAIAAGRFSIGCAF